MQDSSLESKVATQNGKVSSGLWKSCVFELTLCLPRSGNLVCDLSHVSKGIELRRTLQPKILELSKLESLLQVDH